MGTVAPPVLPEHFFRYRSLGPKDSLDIVNREMDAIVQSYIYCGDFLKLNDPMEGDFALTARLMKRPEAQEVLDAISTGQTDVGIASLSDTLNNDLMWTHYANNWSGICMPVSRAAPRQCTSARRDGSADGVQREAILGRRARYEGPR
jgi:hypothetical protein